MRAISVFSFDAGTSSFWWRARMELRMRVTKSATGSVKLILSPPLPVRSGLIGPRPQNQRECSCYTGNCYLPTGLNDAGNFAPKRQLAEAQAAKAKLAQVGARSAANLAAIMLAAGKLRLAGGFYSVCCGCHSSLLNPLCLRSLTEGYAELPEQGTRLVVVFGCRHDGDVHALQLLHARIIHFRKNQLVAHAQRVVASSIEALGGNAAKVTYAGQGHRDQPVEKFVHDVAAQGHHGADGHALAHLEGGNRLLGLGGHRLLPGYRGQVSYQRIHNLYILRGLAQAHIQDDLLQAGNSHEVAKAKLFLQCRPNFLVILFLESRVYFRHKSVSFLSRSRSGLGFCPFTVA